MKKLLMILMTAIALNVSAAELVLEVDPSSPGFNQDTPNTIDAASVASGDQIVLRLVLRSVDFGELAGFEGSITFPPALLVVRTDFVGQASAPFQTPTDAGGWNTNNLQKLPADANGADTASTFDNPGGEIRIGAIVTNSVDRPSSGDVVLGTIRFALGRDVRFSDLSVRDLATCISASETLRFIAGGNLNYIVADGSAQSVSVTANTLTVNVTNSDAAHIASDADRSGGRNPGDLLPAILCILNSSSESCPLTDVDSATFNQILDADCSGAVNTGDLLGNIVRILNFSRSASKAPNDVEFTVNGSKGQLMVEGGVANGAVAMGEVIAEGRLGDFRVSPAAQKRGWVVVNRYIPHEDVYRYVVFNTAGENGVIPAVEFEYETAHKQSKVWLADQQVFSVGADRAQLVGPQMRQMPLEK